MPTPSTFLVFGGTGGTGKHFIALALQQGHHVRALARTPSKLTTQHRNLQVTQGSITSLPPQQLDTLVAGADYVVCMLGDKAAQRTQKINNAFVRALVPSMRRHGVKRLLYQAGGLSKPAGGELTWVLWAIRKTVARGFDGQHLDNEAVMEYLANEARDIEWVVHRAGIGSDGASKGRLVRSETKFSIATHRDCAKYNFEVVQDDGAVRTQAFSHYVK